MLGFVGTDYKRSHLDDLELVYFNKEAISEFSSFPCDLVVLSTCNRTEFYFVSENPQVTARLLKQHISERKKVPMQTVERILQPAFGADAIEHLFHVVSGTESMVFGENEILTQVKDAYASSGAKESLLNKLFQTAITVGKKVRKETQISRGSYSVTSIAIDGLRDMLPDFETRKMLIVGAGTMGMRAIKKLAALKHQSLYISNRSEDKLDRICEKYGLTHVPFNQLQNRIGEFDVALFATSSDHYLLGPSSRLPGVIVDLGLPRNVDPAVESPAVKLLTLEGLEKIAEKNIQNRMQEMPRINEIIAEEIDKFMRWYDYKRQICLPKYA